MRETHKHNYRVQWLLAALLVALLALALGASPALAAGPEEPECQPWICRPPTAGLAPIEGRVIGVLSEGRPFHAADARFMYRTAEMNREASGAYANESKPLLGPWHSLKLGSNGTFKVSVPACSANEVVRTFGCVGGEYEAYPTYEGQTCGEGVGLYMTVGETNTVELMCTPPKPMPTKQSVKHKKGKHAKKRH